MVDTVYCFNLQRRRNVMRHKSAFVFLFLLLSLVLAQYVFAAQIRLAWNANSESDLAGYRVYYGNSSKSYTNSVDVGDQTTFALTGLKYGTKYFIILTACDTSNNESTYSTEVSGVASELTTSNEVIPPTITTCASEIPCNTGSNIYVASYDQNTDGMPVGNVKQYELSPNVGVQTETQTAAQTTQQTGTQTPTQPTAEVGTQTTTQTPTQTVVQTVDVLDSTKSPVLETNNPIKDSSQSTWSSQPDGNKVDSGGVGGVLATRTTSRNIFTYLGDSNLTAESNAFTTQNQKITSELLGLASGDKIEREKLIQFIQGFDAQTKDKGKITYTKRKWILGAVVNSRPLVVPYGNKESVIFVGANDGMLHAFDNITGEELWGFIPTELLSRLKDLTQDNQLKFYVDGSPKVYITDSQKIIVFGLRKGGSNYYALDVTEAKNPKFLWKIGPETPGYSEIAQTWSTPQIGKIKYGKDEKAVIFIGGGYDKNQNRKNLTAGDKKGRAVYVTDILTGTQVWKWDYQKDPNMKYSIPSDIARVDTNGDGYIERLYVGDMGGRLWRFDINDSDPNSWLGRIIFNSNTGVTPARRKIFYPPDLTLENGYEMVLFGTGDREHQDETKVVNRIYAFRDKGSNSILSEDDLANLTKDIASIKNFEHKEGWFISLEADKGEKVLAPPVVVYGVGYFTTYTPSPNGSDGIARIYSLNYKTGYSAFNLSKENDTGGPKIDLSDRSKIIGKGIPSGTIISAVRGRLVALTGVEGGIYRTPLRGNSTLIPIWWKEVRK
jgi:type IV pilus assembly protein PilY1